MNRNAKLIAVIVTLFVALSVTFALAQTVRRARPGAPSKKMTQKAPAMCCPNCPMAKAAGKPAMKPGMRGMGPGKPMGGMMGGMHPVIQPAIAVDNTSVYVYRGNELLKFDKNTLELEKQVMLPPPAGGMRMPRGQMGPSPGGMRPGGAAPQMAPGACPMHR
jgi:hypothetical protein